MVRALASTQFKQPPYPFAVIGVDPGGTTGIAEYTVDAEDKPAMLQATAQVPEMTEVVPYLHRAAGHWMSKGYNIVFVIEQFDKRPGVANPDYSAMYVIQYIKPAISDKWIVWQTPSQAKNLIKPASNGKEDGLKRFGYFATGQRHANDASRHVLTYLVEKAKHKPTQIKGWPKHGETRKRTEGQAERAPAERTSNG